MRGADIYDQQEIRRFAESGGTDVTALAKRLRISEECAQSWVDHFNGVVKPVAEVEDIYEVKPEVKITSKNSRDFGKNHGDSE